VLGWVRNSRRGVHRSKLGGATLCGPAKRLKWRPRQKANRGMISNCLQAHHFRPQRQGDRRKAAASDRHILGPVAAGPIKAGNTRFAGGFFSRVGVSGRADGA